MAAAQPSGEVLPYADAELPEGVTELTADGSRADVRTVQVPSPVAPACPTREAVFTIAALAAAFVILVCCAAFLPEARSAAINLFTTVLTIAGLGWLVRLRRRSRRLGFEVNPYELRMATGDLFGHTRRRWPRSKLADIRMSTVSGALVIRLVKDDSVDVFVSDDPAVTRKVTDELLAALAAIPAAPPGSQLHPVDPSAGLPPGQAKNVLHRIGIALTLAALAGIPLTRGLSLALLVPAGICIGIALGSQRKDLWV